MLDSFDVKQVKGAYIIGQIWTFAILEKDEQGYQYYVAPILSAARLDDLKMIYKNLQAVKHSLPKD